MISYECLHAHGRLLIIMTIAMLSFVYATVTTIITNETFLQDFREIL